MFSQVSSFLNASNESSYQKLNFMIFQGYRIVLQAKDEHKPVAILNIGPTRADHLADLKISTVAGQVLRKVTLT